MKNRRAVIACGIFAAACLWLTGCGEEQDAKGVFSLNPATLEIEAGDSFDLTPEYQNFDGLDESALMVKWSSSAPAVAAVSEGTVIGVEAGEAVITASVVIADVDYHASCAVTVSEGKGEDRYEVNFVLDEETLSLNEGETHTLLPELSVKEDGKEVDLPVPGITWKSSDETVASVSGGHLEALKAGEAEISASVLVEGKEYTAKCAVTVEAAPALSVFLDRESAETEAGSAFTLVLSVKDADGKEVTDAKVVWTSSDETVASVKDGRVTGLNGGYAVIAAKVSADGREYLATCDLTVHNAYAVNAFGFANSGHAFAYAYSEGSAAISGLLERLEFDVERNGEKLSDLTAVTELRTAVGGDNLSLSDGKILFSGTGEGTFSISLIEPTDGSEIASARADIIVADEVIGTEAEFLTIDGSGYYVLADNLNFGPGYALGTAEAGVSLTGTLDGNGYSVCVTLETGAYNNSGLFNVLDGGTVRNLSLSATFGTIRGLSGWMYRSGALAVTAKNGAVVENCYVRAEYTDATSPGGNHGITGLIGYPDGDVTVKNTIVAVSAPARATYVYGILVNGWGGWYRLQNVFVYLSGENIPMTSDENFHADSTYYKAFTGGTLGVVAEQARQELLRDAGEKGLRDFVCGEFEKESLYETASVAFAEENPVNVYVGEQILLSVIAKNLYDGGEISSSDILWTSSEEKTATVSAGTVTGISEGEVSITAAVTVQGKTYQVSCQIKVNEKPEDLYEISLSFDKEVYNLEGGTVSAGTLSYTVTATKNGEAWDGWTEYVTLSSSDETKLAITEEGLQVLGTGSVTVTLKYSYAGLEKSATATAELWTEIIETAEEFLSLGEWKNGTMPDWSGRYLIGQDLDFAGKTVTVLGNVTGTIDGGGHTLKHVELAATGIGLSDSSKTAAGDDRFLFYNVDGTIRNLKLSVTLGGERVGERSAGLCYQLNGRLEQSELNVRFRSLSNGQSHKMTGGVCVYAGWQSETVGCKVNVFWVFTDWGSNGQYVVVNDRGYAYCYTFWGTKSAKVTDTEFGSTAYLLYASNNDNFINGNCTIAQSSDAYLTSEEAEALFA